MRAVTRVGSITAAGLAAAVAATGMAAGMVTPRRTASQRVPTTARVVTVVSARGAATPGRALDRRRIVTDRAKVRQIAALVDRLPVFPPGVRSCPVDLGIYAWLTFRPRLHGRALAVARADPTGCGEVVVTTNGQRRQVLAGGPALVIKLDKLLGLQLATGR